MKRYLKAAGLAALLAVPASANAQVFSAPGVGGLGPIPDGAGTGVPGVPTVSQATIVSGGGVVQNVSIDFGAGGLVHTWAGDLTVTLTHPNGTTVQDIMRRPGRGSASTFGFNSDFLIGNSYSFSDAGTDLFAVAPPATIASGNYRASTNAANPADPSPPPEAYAYTATSFATTFGGLPADGAWTLTITDWGGGDVGSLNGWTLNVTVVPEPTSLTLCGVAAGGLVWRRWRRKA